MGSISVKSATFKDLFPLVIDPCHMGRRPRGALWDLLAPLRVLCIVGRSFKRRPSMIVATSWDLLALLIALFIIGRTSKGTALPGNLPLQLVVLSTISRRSVKNINAIVSAVARMP